MNTHLKLYLLILLLAALVVVGFLWWQTTQEQDRPTEGLGGELYPETGNPADNLPTVNSLENKPEVNPLSGSNPFSEIKTNPFR